MKTFCSVSFLSLFFFINLNAQDFYEAQRKSWQEKAEKNKPSLVETIKKPLRVVSLVKDETVFQGWKAVNLSPMDSLYKGSFKKKSGIVVDFGEHLTGYCSFTLSPVNTPDGPLRFKFTFAEMPAELCTPYEPFTGAISRAWIQDEIITLVELGEQPSTITIPRRVAFRYVKIELLGSSQYFDFSLSEMYCKATTSVTSTAYHLAPGTEQLIKDIDRVGLTTLKECMQTVYEDGPKRDRRLWIGDLYLESLANTYSFKNHTLTKRCMYLLAGYSDPNGYLLSNVFETPEPHGHKGVFLFDYCLLYNVALKEYFLATYDMETVADLWPVAKKQLEIPKKYIGKDGMFDHIAAGKEWWLFIDWKDDLDKQAALQGLVLFAMKETYELARLLGKENEVAELPALIKKMTAAAKTKLWDKESGLFLSGPSKQISYASQAWMVLSGVASKEEGQNALKFVGSTETAVRPGAPYLYHYYVEAMIRCGLQAQAKESILSYWGDMVRKGADTFWEVYDPKNDLLSPYNFHPLNSYCHAWSCTPVYFIRKYPDIFQK
jgi:alpha-L-rhamnosidase